MDFVLSFRNPRDRQKHLSELPITVHEAYHKLINRMSEADTILAFKILAWVFYAKRPLHMEELREAICVEEGDKDLQVESLTPSEEILECCQGLIVCKHEEEDSDESDCGSYSDSSSGNDYSDSESGYSDVTEESSTEDDDDWTDDESSELSEAASSEVYSDLSGELSGGIVRFTHQTVKEFLEKEFLGKDPLRRLANQVEITRTCLRYLTFDEFARGPGREKDALRARMTKYKFGRYAAVYWGDHAREAGQEVADVQQDIWKLLVSDNMRESMFEITWNSRRSIERAKAMTMLHILAYKGLADMCRVILNGTLSSVMYLLRR